MSAVCYANECKNALYFVRLVKLICDANECENALALLYLFEEAYNASVVEGEALRKAEEAERNARVAEQKKADDSTSLRSQATILWDVYHTASSKTRGANMCTMTGVYNIGSVNQPFKKKEDYDTTTPLNLPFHNIHADDCLTAALKKAKTAEINKQTDHAKFSAGNLALREWFNVNPKDKSKDKSEFDALVTNASVCGKNDQWSEKVSTAAKIAVKAAEEYVNSLKYLHDTYLVAEHAAVKESS